MNTQPTPETDAALYPMNQVDIVWPEFARKLERERDEAREQRDRLAKALKIAANRFRYPAFGCNWEDASEEIESALQSLTPNTKP